MIASSCRCSGRLSHAIATVDATASTSSILVGRLDSICHRPDLAEQAAGPLGFLHNAALYPVVDRQHHQRHGQREHRQHRRPAGVAGRDRRSLGQLVRFH